ncbi:unnamed protein product, partial [Mesorhabditis spiculigera]
MCAKVLACRDVSILVRHAKTHHPKKQFSCRECDYTNSERRNMRQHIFSVHGLGGDQFSDDRTSELEDAWARVGGVCFPEMSERISEAVLAYRPKLYKGKPIAENVEDDDDFDDCDIDALSNSP